jgi:hypothetical protein
MARTFTLGTLVTRAQERTDLENSTHIDSSEWKGYISTAYAQLYSILVESGMRYYESVQSISSASLTDNTDGGGFIALPADFLSTIGVDYAPTGGMREALFELMVQERNVYSAVTGAQNAEAYCHSGVNLILYPKPPSGQTYKHLYVPQPADLSSSADGTSVDVVTPDGEDYLIWTAAMFALTKQETDTSVCERYRKAAQERLMEWAVNRSLNTGRRPIVSEALGSWDPADWRRRW